MNPATRATCNLSKLRVFDIARSVTIEEQETVLTRRAIIAPGLPPGALAVALDDLGIVEQRAGVVDAGRLQRGE